MNIHITDEATQWYEQELDIQSGDAVRFFVRYGGIDGRIAGFSLGLSVESPDNIYASVSKNGITFFIEETDAWYFDQVDLNVQFDKNLEEPQFIYES